jgi:uncharacterized damage-inducible protein DinB
MSIGTDLLPEWDQEMLVTRRVIERVPSEKGEWKPHPKSFSLAHLTQLVAWMPGWVTMAITRPELDLKSGGGGYSTQTTETLLKEFDKNSAAGRKALEEAQDSDFKLPWSLKMGDQVLMTMTRGAVVRQTISHLSHHRGQLTVYLRLLDVPVPSVYGPTADDNPWR